MTGNSEREKELERKEKEMMADAYWDGYEDAARERGEAREKRFRRNKIDGVLGGVCAGIGDYTGIDAIWVRLAWLAAVVFFGFPLVIYFLLWLIVPSDKRAPYYREAREMVRAERRYHARDAKLEREISKATRTARTHAPTTKLSDVRSKYRSLEERMQDLERSITSKEWQLKREFRDLEK